MHSNNFQQNYILYCVKTDTEKELMVFEKQQGDYELSLTALRESSAPLLRAFVAATSKEKVKSTPNNRHQDEKYLDWDEIYGAELIEMQTILLNETRELVEPREGIEIIGTTWQYAQKMDESRDFSHWKRDYVREGIKRIRPGWRRMHTRYHTQG